MTWLELTIDAPERNIDLVTARLDELGATGLVITDEADFTAFLEENQAYWDYVDDTLQSAMAGQSRVTFYLEASPEGKARLAELCAALPWPIAKREIQEEDWANNWKTYYRPIPIGQRLLVVPEWEDIDPAGRIPLRLDPGLIFGTGAHPTTKMCLEIVERLTKPGQQVLDLGTGSGILSIAALLLGAEHVLACDIDPKAPDVVRANGALNGLGPDKLTAVHGGVLAPGGFRAKLGSRQYDLILANIVADVLISLAGFTAPWLAPAGYLVCSGIIDGREDEVSKALVHGGFRIIEQHKDGDWHSFVCAVEQYD
ncbi:MAG: 50S ribosomal protein L11 methyltransferase [Oscillospiraceae bacterium]|nr:50S ribosomal protein L11 methyltransferase [Oscillospiraceae bacterium]